jgi:hypothetical protein
VPVLGNNLVMPLPKSDNKFRRTLQAYLTREGINAYTAATRIGVRHQRLYTWLNGQCLPGRGEADRIGQAIGVPGLGDTVARLRRRRARVAGAA